ncbi:MAG: transketolase family protein [Anaerolineae bacterium]
MRTPEKLAMREAFALAAIELADQVPNMVVLDADVSKSTKSAMFAQAHPQRFLNVGIAEQNMVAIAAGLAAAGMVPVVNTFSMLLSMRALDQLRQSVAYPRLNVKIMGHYAGYSAGPEGASHHAIEDMGIIRTIPNMTLIAPCDVNEAKEAFKAAVLHDGPVYLRLSRNPVPQVFESPRAFRIGEGYEMRAGSDLTFITTGIMLVRALDAAEELAQRGIEARVVAMPTVKPLDRALVERAARETGAIVTAEEHNIINGLGSAVAEALVETVPVPMERVGIADVFAESGDYFELLDKYGMGVPNLVAAAERVLRRKAGT